MANALHDPKLDPRLFATPRHPPHSTTAAPPHSAGQPYYLSVPAPAHLSQPAPPGAALDPALEQTSPTGPETSPDDDEHDDEGDVHSPHETPGSAKSPGDVKRPRACDSCRGLKVRGSPSAAAAARADAN
jgi:hypothetical protein